MVSSMIVLEAGGVEKDLLLDALYTWFLVGDTSEEEKLTHAAFYAFAESKAIRVKMEIEVVE